MQPPSWILLIVMVVSGMIAVAANAWYPIVKANEAKASLASDAKSLLLPEVKRNSELVSSLQFSLETKQITVNQLYKFDVDAWETISKGGLLLGLEPTEINKFLQVYRLLYQANDLKTRLLDLSLSVGSTLTTRDQIQQIYFDLLRTTLGELQTAFSELGVTPDHTG
jgi:hypothetical protein